MLPCQKMYPFPIEFVVRGYITGSSSTSLWTVMKTATRDYCGHSLPERLKKNQKLAWPIITPTTKEEEHDRPISAKQIIEEGWMDKSDWEFASNKLELFCLWSKDSRI